MKYQWQRKDWPNFHYNSSELERTIYRIQGTMNHLQGMVAALTEDEQIEAHLLVMKEEAISTCLIENVSLDKDCLDGSLRELMGISSGKSKKYSPVEDGIAAMLVEVKKSQSKDLSLEMVERWQRLLMANEHHAQPGAMRNGPVSVVSETEKGLSVLFEAPPAERLSPEMTEFLKWYKSTSPMNGDGKFMPGSVRAAIAHLYFVTIHPFSDGNGRVGRAIAEHALSQGAEGIPLLNLSSCLMNEREAYYEALQTAQRNVDSMDITGWVSWFVSAVERSLLMTKTKLDFMFKRRAFWDRFKSVELNDRQRKVLNAMLSGNEWNEGISNQEYMEIANSSRSTVMRELRSLVNEGCLIQGEQGGRSTRYYLNNGNHPDVKLDPISSIFVQGAGNKAALRTKLAARLLDDIEHAMRMDRGKSDRVDAMISEFLGLGPTKQMLSELNELCDSDFC